MRKKNSMRNMFFSVLMNVSGILIGIISQAIFLKILNSEYLGLNGLFNNIISMLSIVEMGMGSAIIYSLYKPVYDKDIPKIKALMNFYHKSYIKIALVVGIIGISLIPFLAFFVNIDSITIPINIYYIYLLFLLDSVLSYLFSYKRSILYASEKNYIISIVHILYYLVVNTFQLIVLFIFKNYYLYLIVKVIVRLLENFVLSIIANRLYSYLKDNNIYISKEDEKEILKRVRAMFFHKIGAFVINSTDNIIISKYLGLITVGLYSNYFLIIDSVKMVLNQSITSITSSIGNLLIEKDYHKRFNVFKRVRFINFWFTTFASTCILILMEPFINIWIGKEYLLEKNVLLILIFVFYFSTTRATYIAFKDASGICYEDRYVPILESFINILFSIIFVKYFGLFGVFVGTILSSMVLWLFSYPYYVYKKIFNRKMVNYYLETIGYFIIFILILGISYLFSNLITYDNLLILLIFKTVYAVFISNLLLLICYFRNDNFKYFIDIIKSILKQKK